MNSCVCWGSGGRMFENWEGFFFFFLVCVEGGGVEQYDGGEFHQDPRGLASLWWRKSQPQITVDTRNVSSKCQGRLLRMRKHFNAAKMKSGHTSVSPFTFFDYLFPVWD